MLLGDFCPLYIGTVIIVAGQVHLGGCRQDCANFHACRDCHPRCD